MKDYFIVKNDQEKGPLSFQALQDYEIYSDTLAWTEGMEDWKEAKYIPELQAIIINREIPIHSKKTPPRGQNFSSSNHQQEEILDDYDYSRVEDIAGVDYRKGMMVAGVLIFLNIFFKSFMITSTGTLLGTGLAVGTWWYFKQYFDSMQDKDTGKFIFSVMGAHMLFGLTYLFVSTTDWIIEGGISVLDILLGSGLKYAEGVIFSIQMAGYGTLLAMAIIFVSGIRIIWINKEHPFPLKRIAVSSMILIPVGMMIQLVEGISKSTETGVIANFILMLPFLFLLHHFYRADTEDLTQ